MRCRGSAPCPAREREVHLRPGIEERALPVGEQSGGQLLGVAAREHAATVGRLEIAVHARQWRCAGSEQQVRTLCLPQSGTEVTDSKSQDVLTASEPKEMAALVEAIHPREHRALFGAPSPGTLTVPERALRRLPASRSVTPEGDFRDGEDNLPGGRLRSPTR
jgi:hypothetical protein